MRVILVAFLLCWLADSHAADSHAADSHGPLIISYDQHLELVRGNAMPGGPTANPDGVTAIYCGSRAARLVRMIADGTVRTHGVPVVVLSSRDQVTSPVSGREVAGNKLFELYNGTPGTLLFVDKDGLPIPTATLPHLVHGNDHRIIEAPLGYYGSGYNRQSDLAGYATAVGIDRQLALARKRFSLAFLGREISPTSRTITMIADGLDGEVATPWEAPGIIHLVTRDPMGYASLNQLRDLVIEGGKVHAKITLVIPADCQVSPQLVTIADEHSERLTIRYAERADIERGVSPRLVVTTGLPPSGHGKGIEFWGYLPFGLFIRQTGIDTGTTVLTNHNPDLPVGETDHGVLGEAELDQAPATPFQGVLEP